MQCWERNNLPNFSPIIKWFTERAINVPEVDQVLHSDLQTFQNVRIDPLISFRLTAGGGQNVR